MAEGFEHERPPVWIGHVTVPVADVRAAVPFWRQLGMRFITRGDSFAVLELRGGTHVVLRQIEGDLPAAPLGFDLMVEQLERTREALIAAGITCSPVTAERVHRVFTVTDPNGHTVKFCSNHAVGVV